MSVQSIFARVAIAAVLMTSPAFAAEKKIQRSALPAAVEKTVEQQSQGAAIRGFAVETEKGKVVYEVEMTVNGHDKDVSMGKDGTVLEVEEEVAIDSLPAAAKNALIAKAGSGKIVHVEAVSTGSKITSYEADTIRGSKKAEIAVGPDGEKVADED